MYGIYPIANTGHFIISGFPLIILVLYYVYSLAEKVFNKFDEKQKKFFENIFITTSIYVILIAIVISTINIGEWILDTNSSEIKHFENIRIDNTTKENIENIMRYIKEENKKGKKVYILDATACLYMIPLDKYNKNYDLFLKGNLGSQGEQGQIEKIKKEVMNNDVLILILNEQYLRNWQNPEEVRKYIVKNLDKTGEIGKFDIYE